MSAVPPAAPTRFDAMLAAIGLLLLSGGFAGIVSSVPLYAASAASSILAGAVTLYGLVLTPPV